MGHSMTAATSAGVSVDLFDNSSLISRILISPRLFHCAVYRGCCGSRKLCCFLTMYFTGISSCLLVFYMIFALKDKDSDRFLGMPPTIAVVLLRFLTVLCTMPLFISSIASGSNGNCYYVGNDREAVLVDAGISCRQIEKRMAKQGLSIDRKGTRL